MGSGQPDGGQTVGIGVLGATSSIAQRAVIPAILAVDGARLAAGASTSSREIAAVDRVHDSYEALLEDPEVDAVYIPLPNHLHAEWTIAAARAGRHVLCEKPLGRDAEEAEEMARACAEAGVVLMEAYMTPHHPRSRVIAEMLATGRLGELRHGFARFTGIAPPENHRWRPETGGGAVLDLGIYCLEPQLLAAGWDGGAIPEVAAAQVTGGGGVDGTFSGWLRMAGGAVLSFLCSMEAPERQLLQLVGTQASLEVDRAYIPGRTDDRFVLHGVDGGTEHVTGGGDPYEGMVEAFCRAVTGERPLERGPDRSIALQRVIDRLRTAAS